MKRKVHFAVCCSTGMEDISQGLECRPIPCEPSISSSRALFPAGFRVNIICTVCYCNFEAAFNIISFTILSKAHLVNASLVTYFLMLKQQAIHAQIFSDFLLKDPIWYILATGIVTHTHTHTHTHTLTHTHTMSLTMSLGR